MRELRAVVIGGGVGGLTAAAALHHRGWDVTVLERAASLEPVGAGIALAANAQRALDTFGAGDAVRALSVPQVDGGLRRPGGYWLSRTDNAAAARRFGGPVVVAHRADVIALLASRLPEGAVRTGVRGELADPGGPDRPARVTTPGGVLEAELVVGADGIHSAVRAALFPGHPAPRYTGFTTWRFVVPAAAAPQGGTTAHETWGPGRLWGTVPCSTAASTPTPRPPRPPARSPRAANSPSCAASSATGTTPCRSSSPPPTPPPCCATTSTAPPTRCPPTTTAGSPSSATPPTP
ncbi:monooxygenase [Streptomyces albireticuli]|uniref:Monooxygenase n=1 Tax=Streptomyces albireticuli TaxID=1940 RepID=A0A1Z2LAJ3_9ACTN|nr:monooxygenase [Streptomyces albireticuli]